MMDLNGLKHEFEQLSKMKDVFGICGLIAKAEACSEIETLTALLSNDWVASEGWVAQQSSVYPKTPGVGFQFNDQALIAAELMIGAKSLHVRQRERGWIVTEYTHCNQDETDKTAGAKLALFDNVTHVYARDPTIGLKYIRYWRLNDMIPEVYACRFAGFDPHPPKEAAQ